MPSRSDPTGDSDSATLAVLRGRLQDGLTGDILGTWRVDLGTWRALVREVSGELIS